MNVISITWVASQPGEGVGGLAGRAGKTGSKYVDAVLVIKAEPFQAGPSDVGDEDICVLKQFDHGSNAFRRLVWWCSC